MALRRLEHVGVVVEDLAAATEFFLELGLERQGEGEARGEWVDRVVGLEGVEVEFAMLQTPGGDGCLELIEFRSPPSPAVDAQVAANVPGLRHLAFLVDDLEATLSALRGHGAELIGEVENYRDVYRLCYLRGPAGVIVELAEEVG